MKLTKSQLKQIIKEEIGKVMEALEDRVNPDDDDLEQAGFRLADDNIPQTKEEVYAAAGLDPQEIQVAEKGIADEMDIFETSAFEKLYEYFAFDGPPSIRMPYGTAKARDEDPYYWVMEYLQGM